MARKRRRIRVCEGEERGRIGGDAQEKSRRWTEKLVKIKLV